MALTEKLAAVADAIRAQTGGTALLTLAEMPGQIAAISGGELAPLALPAETYNIEQGYQAYDSGGRVLEGTRDIIGELNSLSAEIESLNQQMSSRYQDGYNDGYNAGYQDAENPVQSLTYAWDEDTLTLTVMEV